MIYIHTSSVFWDYDLCVNTFNIYTLKIVSLLPFEIPTKTCAVVLGKNTKHMLWWRSKQILTLYISCQCRLLITSAAYIQVHFRLLSYWKYSKQILKRALSKRTPTLVFCTDYRLMQVKYIAECSKGGAFCNTSYLHLAIIFHSDLCSVYF